MKQYIDRCITMFGLGYINKKKQEVVLQVHPQQYTNIHALWQYISNESCAGRPTALYRQMLGRCSDDECKAFKRLYFENALFAGVFKYRNAAGLVRRSPFMPIDIDHLGSFEEARELKQRLVLDTQVETALAFISPSGLGVKWIVELPTWTQGLSFRQQYIELSIHVGFNYGYQADPNCKDVCRGCFLPYDPQCYINEKYKPL